MFEINEKVLFSPADQKIPVIVKVAKILEDGKVKVYINGNTPYASSGDVWIVSEKELSKVL